MIHFAQITQYIFCLTSMALTALFAFSLSGITTDDLWQTKGVTSSFLLLTIFLLIGACIDAGKYLFWLKKGNSLFFLLLSLLLMIFSWLASCAYLISSELSLLESAKTHTSEYISLQADIENIENQIRHQEILISRRLGSTYHSEWAKADAIAEKIAQLKTELSVKIASLSNLSEDAIAPHVATTQFFHSISNFMGADARTIRLLSYGLLSFLLEISTLGMLSLVKDLKLKPDRKDVQQFAAEEKAKVYAYPNEKQQEQAVRLISDILCGKTAPVVRDIKSHYKLDFRVIQEVMRSLYRLGVLCNGKRNSYKLAPAISPNAGH